MTNLPEMTPSAAARADAALEGWSAFGDDTLDSHDFYAMEIDHAFRDGALAERARIVAMLREPSEELQIAVMDLLEAHGADRPTYVLSGIADRVAAEGDER